MDVCVYVFCGGTSVWEPRDHVTNAQSSNKRRSMTDSEADDMRQHTSTAIKKKNTNAHAWGHSEICL